MENSPWSLESFVDSLVLELDRTRETLAIKAINKPLTYTVKDLALDLHIFPSFDGENLRFLNAKPGQEGSSKISLQFSSITDQQVRATSKAPLKEDIRIEKIDVDPQTKRKLQRLGVTSVSDLEKIEQRKVDIPADQGEKFDYTHLANIIRKARRGRKAPAVEKVSAIQSDAGTILEVKGKNLSVDQTCAPVAILNSELAEVMEHSPEVIQIRVPGERGLDPDNEIILTLDPYCIVRFNLQPSG